MPIWFGWFLFAFFILEAMVGILNINKQEQIYSDRLKALAAVLNVVVAIGILTWIIY